MKRIARMAGLPSDKHPENLQFLALRKYTPEIRIAIVEAAFPESERYGYSELMKALKRGYAAIGCVYGENKLCKLKTFLENKRMIVKDAAKKYGFNPDYHY